MYDISFAIVTYNNENLIESTINSLVTFVGDKLSYVIYIIDNASEDNTLSRVKKCKGNLVILENDNNIGFGAAHNKVLTILDSLYHVAVNPDITVENNCIAEMFEYMEQHDEIGLLTPLIRHPNGEIQYLCKHNPTFIDLFLRLALPNAFKKRQDTFIMKETGYNHPFFVEYATGCFMFFRTEIFKQLNGFDPHFFLYLEDADITRRVNQVSKTIFYPYNHVVHQWQRGSHKSIRLMLINVDSAVYYWWKWKKTF